MGTNMKKHQLTKCLAAVLGSLAMMVTQADAKPGNSGGKGQGKGGAAHSQKAGKAKEPGKAAKAPGKAVDKIVPPSPAADIPRFKDKDRKEIVDYFGRFRTQGEGLPPGLAMNQRRGKPLPPGWQKKLVPGYRIEDSLWSGFAPVPSSWFPNIRMQPHTRLYYQGDRVVRVYEPRREVVDVIVLPPR